MTPSLKEPNGDAPDPVVALADKYEADRAYFNATDRDSDDRDHPVGHETLQTPSTINFRFGSKADELRHRQKGLLLGVKRTKSARKRTSALELPLLGAKQTYRQHGRRVRF